MFKYSKNDQEVESSSSSKSKDEDSIPEVIVLNSKNNKKKKKKNFIDRLQSTLNRVIPQEPPVLEEKRQSSNLSEAKLSKKLETKTDRPPISNSQTKASGEIFVSNEKMQDRIKNLKESKESNEKTDSKKHSSTDNADNDYRKATGWNLDGDLIKDLKTEENKAEEIEEIPVSSSKTSNTIILDKNTIILNNTNAKKDSKKDSKKSSSSEIDEIAEMSINKEQKSSDSVSSSEEQVEQQGLSKRQRFSRALSQTKPEDNQLKGKPIEINKQPELLTESVRSNKESDQDQKSDSYFHHEKDSKEGSDSQSSSEGINNRNTNYIEDATATALRLTTMNPNDTRMVKTFKTKYTLATKLSRKSTIKQGGIGIDLNSENEIEKTILLNNFQVKEEKKETKKDKKKIDSPKVHHKKHQKSNTPSQSHSSSQELESNPSNSQSNSKSSSGSGSGSSTSSSGSENSKSGSSSTDSQKKTDSSLTDSALTEQKTKRNHDSLNSHSFVNSIDFGDQTDESEQSAKLFKPIDHEYYDIFSLSRHGKYMELEAILLKGVDPDSRDCFGNTILLVGAQNGNKRIVKLALRYGGQINMFNHMGNTALHFATQYNYYNLIDYLIKKVPIPK